MDQTNSANWFDAVGVTLHAEDELKLAAYDAGDHFNAHVRRVS